MELFRNILVFLHLVGFASLFGGAFVQARDRVKVINHAMLDGALLQVATGLLLVGVIEGMDDPLDRTQVGVKLGLGLVVALLCWVNRAKESVPHGLFNGLMLLTLLNVGVAVFW